MQNLIKVVLEHVDARIEQTQVLRDVSLELEAGQHLGIVGPNGSGKSTLLRLIGGTHWPAPGGGRRLYWFSGTKHTDAVEARKRITLVGPELQDAYLRLGWNFSALDVVVTGLHRTEIPRHAASQTDISKAEALLDTLGASAFSKRPFFELSRGEQRRVLIARALAFRPDVLLLDEPASGLDRQARNELDQTIELAAQQATIVASAHTIEALPRIIKHVVFIREQSVSTVREIRAAASHRSDTGTSADQQDQSVDTDAPPLVELRNADIWLGEQRVLCDVNWRLEKNSNWIVTGRNGAGKSTFLRVLHGQIRPARGGSISWPAFGNPGNVWELRRNIGWVSPELQADYRYPTTVAQCVASGFQSSVGQTRGLTDIQCKRRDKLLKGFRLEEYRDRLLSRLSYGQARRTLLARTLARSPRLLLLDEPWEGLDPDVTDIVHGQLSAAMAAGTQIVCASHIGDAGLGLQNQMVIADGTIHVSEVV